MNKQKSLATLIAIVLVVLILGYVATTGFSIGLYEIKPLGSAIKQGLDLTGGVSAVYQARNLDDPNLSKNIDTAMAVFRTRLDSEGFPEATLSRQGDNRIRIEIPINETSQVKDPNEITRYLVATAKVTFVDPENNVVFEGKDMKEVEVKIIEGNQYVVAFKLNDEATQAFAKSTTEHVGEPITIKLDDNVVSSPTVNQPITGGEGYIEGGFTAESASRLSNQIRSGVLPIELEEIEVRSISATLGEEALKMGVIAGVIGLVLIMIFMAIVYRASGVAADIALAIYVLLVMFAMATIDGVQLTLPGIAGFILAIGMAVDANIIIFERMNEELCNGKSMRTALQSGFSRAFSAILDSNVTTIIAAGVLLYFGTGSIKGFAMTLLIGIVASFVTAVFVTRGLLKLFVAVNSNPNMYARGLKRRAQ